MRESAWRRLSRFVLEGEGMERMRVDGRFVREGLDGGGVRPKQKKDGLRPTSCRTFTRARVAEALPEIVERFVDEAKKGSIAHAKLLTSLGGLDKAEMPKAKKRRGKSMVALLMERLGEKPEGKDAKGNK
jgi:hypothetical protein